MASDIRNLIEEYQDEAAFQENQVVQWRGLATALVLQSLTPDGYLDEENNSWFVGSSTLEQIQDWNIDAEQVDGEVVITLTKADDVT